MSRYSSIRARQFVAFSPEVLQRLQYLGSQFSYGWVATALRRVYLHPHRVDEVLGLFEAMLFERENMPRAQGTVRVPIVPPGWEDYYKALYRDMFGEEDQPELARFLGPE